VFVCLFECLFVHLLLLNGWSDPKSEDSFGIEATPIVTWAVSDAGHTPFVGVAGNKLSKMASRRVDG
jgi:hypothetical protein